MVRSVSLQIVILAPHTPHTRVYVLHGLGQPFHSWLCSAYLAFSQNPNNNNTSASCPRTLTMFSPTTPPPSTRPLQSCRSIFGVVCRYWRSEVDQDPEDITHSTLFHLVRCAPAHRDYAD